MKTYLQTSINNTQLNQSMLIEQSFSGLASINDEPTQFVNVSLPYLLDLYISKNKATLTYAELVELARFSRYLVDSSVKLENLPALRVRFNIEYDYLTVPTVNPLSQLRTGRIVYLPATNNFKYRFVVNNIPNSPTFDVYKDSNFVVTDVDTVFTFGNIEFIGWLQNNRFGSLRDTLETYFSTNFTIEDLMDFVTTIVPNQYPKERLGESYDYEFIKYLSNSLELLESLV